VALIGSYLSDRYQCACASVGGILSEVIAVTRGVVQDSVLGPLLSPISYVRRRCAALSD
jgi:hypothetical protein